MEIAFDLNVKEDGVYLYINRTTDKTFTRADVMTLIDSYAVRELDEHAVDEALRSSVPVVEVKISSDINIMQVNESAFIEPNPDRMEAHITFAPPVNNGNILTRTEIEDMLKGVGIVPDQALINAALRDKKYNRKILIAKGTEPQKGKDGFLQFHFDRSNIKPKPKIMEDGTVNFKQLGMFRLTNKGDVLVTVIPEKPGIAGVDIYGNEKLPDKSRPAAPIPRGKGTVLSTDGLHLIAETSGQLLLQGGKINISPHLEITANVDNSTGNVDFNGQVTIRGNVVSGFTVRAVGNIEVFGVCEGSKLVSTEGNIILGSGVQGAGKAEIYAAQDVTAKFIEGSKVTAGGNISSDSIMKSDVKCDGSVTLTGKNGLLVGGTCVAGDRLVAQTIGSPMGTLTEIEVGGSPKEMLKQKELIAEFNKIMAEYDKCDKAVTTLTLLKQKNQLPNDKKAILVKMINMKMVYRDKIAKVQEEIDMVTRSLAVSAGTVTVGKIIRPGVRITIGNAQITIRDELSNCRLRNNGEKIIIVPNL